MFKANERATLHTSPLMVMKSQGEGYFGSKASKVQTQGSGTVGLWPFSLVLIHTHLTWSVRLNVSLYASIEANREP